MLIDDRTVVRRLRLDRAPAQRGTSVLYIVVLVPTLLIGAGVGFDVSAKISRLQQVDACARNAARAGVQAVGPTAVLGGTSTVYTSAARVRAQRFIASQPGMSGTASISGQALTVEVSSTSSTRFLNLIGVHSLSVHANRTVQLEQVR